MHADPRFTRRGFLAVSSLAGAGLIFNVGWLNPARGDDSVSSAQTLTAARRHMKTNGRPGIAIVVPDDPAARAALAKQLTQVFPLTQPHGSLPAGADVLLEAVWVCVSAKDVDAQTGETLVLLTPEGKRSAGAQADFAQAASVHAAAEKLLAAGRSARTKREAEPQEIADALKKVQDPNTYWEGVQALQPHFAAVASAVIHARLTTKDPEVRQAFGRMLNDVYWNRLNGQEGFPWGAQVRTEVNEPDPCPPCGMAMPSIRAREFLGFFSK